MILSNVYSSLVSGVHDGTDLVMAVLHGFMGNINI